MPYLEPRAQRRMGIRATGSRSSDDGSSHAAHQDDLDVPDATAGDGFPPPDLTRSAISTASHWS